MGKPRMILLVRHAQSEGNKNRDIHQMIPDHRVKLTPDGWKQAEEAGQKLRELLRPDDTIRIITSPYRRTRETTEGILSSLTASSEESGPSPFSRSAIKVYEEPRLREQDFGNFQPCSAEMERMWQERADYGHFFYRIPDGESAADAYDRVSGFNESLWRNFSEDDFPSVCILVTHGLMTRVFLMKWYHWSVEYFEDLRNINHCEFVIMKQNPDGGKYVLENKLRTWSELKRRATVTAKAQAAASGTSQQQMDSPSIPARQWGGCIGGCNHDHSNYPRRMRRPTLKDKDQITLPPPATKGPKNEIDDHPVASKDISSTTIDSTGVSPMASPRILDATSQPNTRNHNALRLASRPKSFDMRGRDAGGTLSGAATPLGENENFHFSDSEDRTDTEKMDIAAHLNQKIRSPRRRPTEADLENWAKQSGMGSGARADALGDEPDDEDEEEVEAGHSNDHHDEVSEEVKRFGYRKDGSEESKHDDVKHVQELEAKESTVEASVY